MNYDALRLLSGTPDLPPDTVALTYDDGPGPQSAELSRLLREQGVPGTFFVLGESVDRYGHVLDTFRDDGHTIGLHGYQHRPFRSAGQAASEVSRCAERISGYLGDTAWFRPPYGIGDYPVPGFAGPVGWHAHGQDWDITYRKGQTVEACVAAIADQLIERHGGIALLHDFVAQTEFRPAGFTEAELDLRIVEITRLLIERLRGAGLSFTALPQPVAAPAPQAQAGGAAGTGEQPAKASGGILDLVMPMRLGEGTPLWCAPPLVGLSWCYLALLPHVDARFPLYGLQCRGLRRPEPLPATIEEMAREYADHMLMTQPSGPFQLLGWSLGGNVAFAIAQELEHRGHEIGLLVILDALMDDPDGLAENNEPWMTYNLILTQFGYVPALTPAEANPEARMLELIRRRPGSGLDEWPEQRLRALQRVIKNNVDVARNHRPGRVHGPLLFFSAAQNEPALPEKIASWQKFVDGPIETVEVDCHHRFMLLPGPIERIGSALSDRLARAAEAGQSPIVQPSRAI